MDLIMNNVHPKTLTPEAGRVSDIWDTRLVLAEGGSYFCHAPSGTGKSTLIHLLYGLRNDYEGEIFWDNQLLTDCSKEKWAEWRSQKLGIVFQDLRLFPELSLWDNICLKQALTGAVPLSDATEWLEALGLSSRLHQAAGSLSYGEQQRVAIVRALMQPFRWLLLDEPFSHLDRQNIQIAAEIIDNQVRKQKAGLLVVDVKDDRWFHLHQELCL